MYWKLQSPPCKLDSVPQAPDPAGDHQIPAGSTHRSGHADAPVVDVRGHAPTVNWHRAWPRT